ncbi:MAG TPA: sulfotransferase [Acidimicrobiia bacterium]|nr:sulfotransferase [Acidimicrobiia bacterium]
MSGVPISLGRDALLARAREVTGIDRDDTDAVEALDVLLASLNGESQLHAEGATAMERKLIRLLSNRLRIQRDFAEHPEIRDQEIRPPLIIFGMARTGTTKLQKVLSASGDFNWWPLWQVLNPALHTGVPGESPRPRIDDATGFADWYARVSPEAMIGHEYSTFEPEEECMVLEHTLVTPVFFGFSVVNDYLGWVMRQDIRAQFRFLREMVQYLQWQGLADPAKRWILKCPLYHGMADLIMEQFPGAQIFMMHRNPAENIPSWLKLADGLYAAFANRLVDTDQQVRGLVGGMRRHLRVRAEHPEWRMLDVAFGDLVTDSYAVIERIYDALGDPLTEESKARMLQWEHDNPQHKKGRHTYALDDYGLTAEGVAESFEEYLAFQREMFG